MKRFGGSSALLLSLLLLLAAPVLAQSGRPRVQQFTGAIDASAQTVFYDLYGLEAGQTLYVYVEAVSGDLDTYLALGDIDFEDVMLEDDDSGGGTNSALEFPVVVGGDYSLAVTRYDESSTGDFRLLIGLDAPAVLDGSATPTGDEIAVLYGTQGGDSMEYTDCSVLQDRPVLSGPEERLETDYFVVHYTPAGADGATLHYVEQVAGIIDTIWKREVVEFGWPAPPTDCGEGGDTRYDVYLMDAINSADALGYAMPEGLLGDNPNSPTIEEWGAYSYLVVDNDFSGYGDYLALMRATIAHEFHHSIQFGYDLNDVGGHWFYEATATWMETQVFPQDEDASPYTTDLFRYPDLCIGSDPEDEAYSNRVYAEWLLLDSLAQDYGQQALQRLWEHISVKEGMDSFYTLLDDLGTTPQQVMKRFAIRNLLLDYDLAANFPDRVHVESNINGVGRVVPRATGVQELGVDYLLITKPGVYSFAISDPELSLTFVGIEQPTGKASVIDLQKQDAVDTRPYEYAYVVILNTRTFTDTEACEMADWVLMASDGSQKMDAQPEAKLWNAVRFIPAG